MTTYGRGPWVADPSSGYGADVDAGGSLEVDIEDISKGTQTNDVKITLDGETVSINPTANTTFDINDISKGTQTNDVKITLDSEAVVLGAGTAEIGKLAAGTADIGTVSIDATDNTTFDINDISKGTQTNDVKITLDSETVVLGAGTAEIGKLAAGTADIGTVSIDATDNTTVDINDISKGTQTNDIKITLDSETVVLGAGTAEIGKLAAGTADIGTVSIDATDNTTFDINDISKGTQTNDVKVTLDSETVVLGAGTAEIGKLAAGTADIGTISIDATDNTTIDINDISKGTQTNPIKVSATASASAAGDPIYTWECPTGTEPEELSVASTAATTWTLGQASHEVLLINDSSVNVYYAINGTTVTVAGDDYFYLKPGEFITERDDSITTVILMSASGSGNVVRGKAWYH